MHLVHFVEGGPIAQPAELPCGASVVACVSPTLYEALKPLSSCYLSWHQCGVDSFPEVLSACDVANDLLGGVWGGVLDCLQALGLT